MTIKEILTQGEYEYYGLRNDSGLEVGQTLSSSYIYDYDNDEPTEEEMGGVCTTGVLFEISEDIEEAYEKALEINERLYGHGTMGNVYLVGSNNWNPKDVYEADEDERILADAVVLAKIR